MGIPLVLDLAGRRCVIVGGGRVTARIRYLAGRRRLSRRGDLLVTLSTSGPSPTLACSLRDDLGARIGPEYGEYLRIVGSVRRREAWRAARRAVGLPEGGGARHGAAS